MNLKDGSIEDSVNRMSRTQSYLFILLVVLVASLIVVPHIATTIQASDGPEFAYLAVLGGLAHPPGYPVFTLLNRFLVQISPANPYYTVSSFSAACTIITTVLLARIFFFWSGSTVYAATLALTWLLLPAVLVVATDAEVFAFHHLFIVSLLTVIFSSAAPLTRIRLGMSAIIFGLGLAHHLMTILWLPLLLSQLFEGNCSLREGKKRFLLLSVGVVLGYSSIALVVFCYQSNPEVSFTAIETPAQFLVCILRLAYGFTSAGITADQVQQRWLIPFFEWLIVHAPILLIGVIAVPFLVLRMPARHKGVALCVLTHLWFCWKLTSEVGMTEIDWISRFFGAPALSLVIALGLWGGPYLQALARHRFVMLIFILLALVPPGYSASLTLPTLSGTQNLHYVKDMLSQVPVQAVFVTTTDQVGWGSVYLQRIEQFRSDLLLVYSGQFQAFHYRELLTSRLHERGIALDLLPDNAEDFIQNLCARNVTVVVEPEPLVNRCARQ